MNNEELIEKVSKFYNRKYNVNMKKAYRFVHRNLTDIKYFKNIQISKEIKNKLYRNNIEHSLSYKSSMPVSSLLVVKINSHHKYFPIRENKPLYFSKRLNPYFYKYYMEYYYTEEIPKSLLSYHSEFLSILYGMRWLISHNYTKIDEIYLYVMRGEELLSRPCIKCRNFFVGYLNETNETHNKLLNTNEINLIYPVYKGKWIWEKLEWR